MRIFYAVGNRLTGHGLKLFRRDRNDKAAIFGKGFALSHGPTRTDFPIASILFIFDIVQMVLDNWLTPRLPLHSEANPGRDNQSDDNENNNR